LQVYYGLDLLLSKLSKAQSRGKFRERHRHRSRKGYSHRRLPVTAGGRAGGDDRVEVGHIKEKDIEERTKGQGHRRLAGMAGGWEGQDRIELKLDNSYDKDKANKLFKFTELG
jgi:hypothetical protein